MEELKKVIEEITWSYKKLEEIKDLSQKTIVLFKIGSDFDKASELAVAYAGKMADNAWNEFCSGALVEETVSQPTSVLPHEERKDTLQLVKRMRKQGATYKEIADYLNEKNILTFSRKGNWHAQSVHRLLDQKKKK